MAENDWKNSATIPVLKLLYNSGVAISPGGITVNLQHRLERPPSRSTVTRAIRGMYEQGLIKKIGPDQPYYQITSKGQKYFESQN